MMVKSGLYTRGYAAAITAATATIGPIIPPSIPMVLYALVSNTSITSLFLGGIVPGLLMGAVLMGMNAWISHKRQFGNKAVLILLNFLGDAQGNTCLAYACYIIVWHILGVTTLTEAAAIAALYALLVSVLLYRALQLRTLYEVFVESARSAASVGLVIGASMILTYVVIQEDVPQIISATLSVVDISPLVFLIFVNVLVLLLGCILDATVIILVIVPLLFRLVRRLASIWCILGF